MPKSSVYLHISAYHTQGQYILCYSKLTVRLGRFSNKKNSVKKSWKKGQFKNDVHCIKKKSPLLHLKNFQNVGYTYPTHSTSASNSPSPRDRASVFFLKKVCKSSTDNWDFQCDWIQCSVGTEFSGTEFSTTDFLQNQKGLHPCDVNMGIFDVVSMWI